MSSRQFLTTQERLADHLRRFGLEGESAFHVLAYHYLLHYADRATGIPRNVAQKWQLAHHKIEEQRHIISLLDELVTQDPLGDKLPEWYQFFIGRRFREGSGKFFTPKSIASAMARLLPLRNNPIIMDPTCGAGTFLVEASNIWRQDNCILVANDVDTSLVDLAMVTLSLATPSHHTKHFSSVNIFDPTDEFISWYGRVDYILANPPFSLRIEHEQFESPLFSLGYRNSDALFIDTAFRLLRPGGRLVCLLPHSIVANKEFANLRLVAENSWTVLGVICLPEGVFHLSAGTTTRADIVVLEKRRVHNEKPKQLVFASVPSVGIRLNNQVRTSVANDLERVLNDSAVREALGI